MKKLVSMLKVDFRRAFTSRLLFIMVGICFVMPILILVMTTMMDGSVTTDQFGNETVIEGFKNVWQIIGSVSGDASAMSMDITSMCNINMLYFVIAVFVGLFVSEDFRSGYAKNIFTVRAKKTDYVIAKTVLLTVSGMLMILAFVVGSMIGGAVSGLPFDLVGVSALEVAMCILAKLLLVLVFVPIFLIVSVAAKHRAWLSIVGSLCVGMLMFTMVPIISPLNTGVLNLLMCLAGGALFSVGLGAVSKLILDKTSIL